MLPHLKKCTAKKVLKFVFLAFSEGQKNWFFFQNYDFSWNTLWIFFSFYSPEFFYSLGYLLIWARNRKIGNRKNAICNNRYLIGQTKCEIGVSWQIWVSWQTRVSETGVSWHIGVSWQIKVSWLIGINVHILDRYISTYL